MLEIGIFYIRILNNFFLLHTHDRLLLHLHSKRGSCEELVSTFWVLLNNWQAAQYVPSNGTGIKYRLRFSKNGKKDVFKIFLYEIDKVQLLLL